jgi:DNA-directed RNA polymerase subunit RPC12/RpoP
MPYPQNAPVAGLGQAGAHPRTEDIEEAFEEIAGSHECTNCGTRKDVNDYQKETPSWCDDCGSVKVHRRVEENE